MFGDEPYGNYNRILLSNVLERHAGRRTTSSSTRCAGTRENGITLHAGVRVDAHRSRGARCVYGCATAVVEPYDTLVIATGSRAVRPADRRASTAATASCKAGVFVFRTLDDCERMLGACAERRKRAAVIGGGLLGLEAARGLLSHGLEVHVVHLMAHLMDDAARRDRRRRCCASRWSSMGVQVHLEQVDDRACSATTRVTGLQLQGRQRRSTATWSSIAAGIRPERRRSAESAGLTVERGIVVDDDMRYADDPTIFAVGECAQHRGMVYGLVAPLWEQAQVLADRHHRPRPRTRPTQARSSRPSSR